MEQQCKGAPSGGGYNISGGVCVGGSNLGEKNKYHPFAHAVTRNPKHRIILDESDG